MLGKREEWGYSRRGRPGPERGYLVRRRAGFPKVAFATALLICGLAGTAGRAAAQGIAFQAPTIVDPIHTFGEPTIGIDPQGRFFASGPTGTGTQRSVWYGSADGGQTFRGIS